MRQGNHIDLRTQAGVKTVTVTPGNSVQYVFDPQQSRIGASGGKPGMFNCVRGIMLSCLATIVRSTGGTTPIWADQFPRVIKSIGLTSPMFGTLLDPTVINGMIARHILEYFGTGYNRPGIHRQPIPGVDTTYTRTFELFIPLCAQGWNPWPDHFDYWLGWLDQSILEIFVEDTAQPFGISGVTITNVAFSAAIEVVPWPELIVPPYVVCRKYQQAASAGSNGPKLTNVGDAGALQGTDDGSRLITMLFSHQTGGFTGSGTADQVSAITMPWRDQQQTTLPQFFFERFIRASRLPELGLITGSDIPDTSAPYPMNTVAAPATGAPLNDVSARYTPLVWPEMGNLISFFQKVKGNYPLDGMTFSAPQSGTFIVYTMEQKQWAIGKVSEMLAAAGIDPTKAVLIPKLGRKNVKAVDPDKLWGFPRGVAAKAA